jgi:hypothetical protein
VIEGEPATTGEIAADGTFRVEVDTGGLEIGEHTAEIRCGDTGEVVPLDFVVAQRVDRNGLGSGTLLVIMLVFLAMSSVLIVALPQPQAARLEEGDDL